MRAERQPFREAYTCAVCACLQGLIGCNSSPGSAVLVETPSRHAVHWAKRDIVLTPAPETPGGTVRPLLGKALVAAAGHWNQALSGCAAPRLLANVQLLDAPVIRDDLVNAVVLHEKRWCPPGVVQPDECYPSGLAGRTHLYPRLGAESPVDGELAGADVEVNGVGQPWAGESSPEAQLKLEAILLHELGHVLGLDHPCGPNSEHSPHDRPIWIATLSGYSRRSCNPVGRPHRAGQT
jgi:hypothetical protein